MEPSSWRCCGAFHRFVFVRKWNPWQLWTCIFATVMIWVRIWFYIITIFLNSMKYISGGCETSASYRCLTWPDMATKNGTQQQIATNNGRQIDTNTYKWQYKTQKKCNGWSSQLFWEILSDYKGVSCSVFVAAAKIFTWYRDWTRCKDLRDGMHIFFC